MNCDLFFASAPRLMVAEPGKAASVRFSRCAPYALSGSLARSLPCLRLISSPLNLLPMFPNDCYPCPRPKHSREMSLVRCTFSGQSWMPNLSRIDEVVLGSAGSCLSHSLSARPRLDGARRLHWKPIRASRASVILKPRKTRNTRKGSKRLRDFDATLSCVSCLSWSTLLRISQVCHECGAQFPCVRKVNANCSST